MTFGGAAAADHHAPHRPGIMRVLYVIDSLMGGGAEHSLAHMAPGYRELGLELHVAFLKAGFEVADALTDAGAVLHPVEVDRGRLRQVRGLVRLIRDVDPDIVHTTLWEADVLGRIAAAVTGRPAVSTFANSSYSAAQFANPAVNRHKLRAAQLVDMATARLASGFHAVSRQVAVDMAARLRVSSDRITVVARARRREVLGEPSADRRLRTRRSLGIDDDVPVVLAIARHEHQKGLDVLVAATAALRRHRPGVVVLVAGRDGRGTTALRSAIERHELTGVVRLLGNRPDVPDLIVAADVVAVASRVEGMPGVVLEAMALERPVVATDLPMTREAIGDDAYALVAVDDAAAMAAALDRCLDDVDASVVAATARRRFDARFTPVPVVAALDEMYQRAITAHGACRVRRRRGRRHGRRRRAGGRRR